MDEIGQSLALILQFALLGDSVVNVVVQAKLDWRKYEYWASILVMVGLAAAFGIDMFAAMGFESQVPFLGEAATGLALSRGANYLHDAFKAVRSVSAANNAKAEAT